MPLTCQAFVENAWKKDLCANCFKSVAEHKTEVERKSLSGKDSLSDLEQGTNRYLTVTGSSFAGNSHYRKQIREVVRKNAGNFLNFFVFDSQFHGPEGFTRNPAADKNQFAEHQQDKISQADSVLASASAVTPITHPSCHPTDNLSITSSRATSAQPSNLSDGSGDGSSSPATLSGDINISPSSSLSGDDKFLLPPEINRMKDASAAHDVIERLDSLVLGTPLSSLEDEVASQASGSSSKSTSKNGILKDAKRDRSVADKKRSITFPDYEELQEIIGYGGDMYYDSDDENTKEVRNVKSESHASEELTQEERNVQNITKKNTSFNSRPQNLKDPSSSPVPKLGVDKKHTPIISVRPFVREHTPGKVNMVSPMINGEVVISRLKKDNLCSVDNKMFGSEESGGRGEIKTKDGRCSDGSTENSSSDSDSNTRDSPSPTDFDLKSRENISTVTEGELYTKQQSFLSSQIDEQKTKSLATNGRSSFLNLVAKSNLSAHKVKTLNYMDEPAQTILGPANTKLSVLDASSVPPDDDGSESNKARPGEKVVATSSPAAARLSFLKSTIGGAGRMTSSQEFVEDNDDDDQANTDGREEDCSNKSDGGPTDSSRVMLTRKSPSVASLYASTSIVRGTQKPMITRKPAILKDKPKVPLKPNKLMLRSPSSSPSPCPSPTEESSPVPAPRTVSFRQKRENLNIDSQPAGDGTKLEETSSITVMSLGKKESETMAAGKDHNNSLIISVSSAKTEHNDPDFCNSTESCKIETVAVSPISGKQSDKSENSPPQVQKNLANKNKEALEAIRKSLSNKLISSDPPKIVKESIKALEGPEVKSFGSKQESNKTSSNSFEENRACIADALQFNRHDNVARPSTKRQAPRPPNGFGSEEADELFDANENEEKSNENNSLNETTTSDEMASNETESFVEPKPAIRNSSMKSEHSVKNKDSKARTVQFSPETVTVTLPSPSSGPGGHKVISYNNWMVKYQNQYLESSFTGQPITMYPPGVMGPQMKKPGLGYPSTPPIVDDGPRKWTEKKTKWRSKSTPRSSEIDEIIGSSKTKAQNKLAIFMPSSPQPIRRQSRVEIYESEKKNLVQKKGKFSLRKLFKLQGLPDSMDDNVDVKFLDKDHEREILERQQKMKMRPEIIHPLDLLNSGVEVIKITPKVQGKSENQSNSKSGDISPVKIDTQTKPGFATKFNPDNSKDSGHDTASIQTETSEEATSSSNEEISQSQGGVSEELSASQLSLGVNSVGKPKPLPPPRSQSLETFQKKESHYEEEDADEEDVDGSNNTSRVTVPVPPLPPSNIPQPSTTVSNTVKTRASMELSEVTVQPPPSPAPLTTNLSIFHAQTSSIAGSINSEAMSDSTLSFPSSSSARKMMADGSEADSERDSVSPQRLHDETIYTDEHSPVTSNRKRVSRLSMRKGRSIVHKNLEDNYGAVITANHEAIAQILEQVCQNRPTPSSLKTLASALNLKFSDFSVLSESEGLRTSNRAFFPATWGASHLPVTLMISKDMTLSNANVKNSFSLTPIVQFVDEVPSYLLPQVSPEGNISSTNQAVVWILSRSNVVQFGTYAKNLKQRRKSLRIDEFEKDMSFVLLQLINGLKYLQAQGIEETVSDLDNFLLARSDNDNYHRLIITEECHRGPAKKMSLCQCALAAMLQLFDISDPVQVACEPRETIELPQIIPSVSMFKTMAVILQKDGGVSLGQVKSMLEYMLWGPSDIIFDFKMSREAESREEALQRWLDLERATVLNNIIRTQGLWNIVLTVYEEYHLLFLVRTCAKMLREASLLFESKVSRM